MQTMHVALVFSNSYLTLDTPRTTKILMNSNATPEKNGIPGSPSKLRCVASPILGRADEPREIIVFAYQWQHSK
jgi:hypothetical protein